MTSLESDIKFLSGFVTRERFGKFGQVLDHRTRYITVVLEDIFQPHNASAVLRSCDCSGVQDVHIIENRNRYTINPQVTLGSEQWLSIIRHNREKDNTLQAIRKLKKKGYRIIATEPAGKGTSLGDFDLEKGKAALFFGTELTGLSQQVISLADENLVIPMFGFAGSFNISVSVAIILYHLTTSLHNSSCPWKLSSREKQILTLQWLKNTINKSDILLKEFHSKKENR